MRDEYFTDNLSGETIIKMTDKTLKYIKNKKYRDTKANLLKIIPAVAAIIFVIGFINISPMFINFENIGIEPHNIGADSENIYVPIEIEEIEETTENDLINDEFVPEQGEFPGDIPANPDDFRWISWIGYNQNTNTMFWNVTACVYTGVIFEFDGEQQSFDKSDLTDLKLTLDGEEIPFTLKDDVRRHLMDEENIDVTWFCLYFGEELDTSGIYQLSGSYRGMPFVSGEMTAGVDIFNGLY